MIDLEAGYGERTTTAIAVPVANLNMRSDAIEAGHPVGRWVADDEEAAELGAIARAFPYVDPRTWVDHELLTEPDLDA